MSKLTKSDLRQFTGSEHWYRHSIDKNITFTDGVKYVADMAGAYWLIDDIVFAQAAPNVKKEEFQVWKLKVNLEAKTAILSCDDGNGNFVAFKRVPYTDFPLDEIVMWFTNQVIYLPSEH